MAKNNKKNKKKNNKKNKNSKKKATSKNIQSTIRKAPEKESFYKKHYKALLIIPFLLLVLAITQIAYQTATTGSFISKGIDLKGGITITAITNQANVGLIESTLKENYNYDFNIRTISELGQLKGIIVEASGETNSPEELKEMENNIVKELETMNMITNKDYSVRVIGPSLGDSFFQQTIKAIIIAFILMGAVVFYYFRTLVPSGAVILAAASDILITVAAINLLGIKLSTAGVAAFLMLLGYSVDTDILLSTRVLKRKEGTVYERVTSALKTGTVMNLTTLAAVSAALILTQSEIIAQIMIILLIGLLADVINTWIQNAGILRMYAEKKKL